MNDIWMSNPLTIRKIKKNGRVYKSLVRANVIKLEDVEKQPIIELQQQEEKEDNQKKPKYELIDLAKEK